MFVRRWWICRSSPTSSMGGDRYWSKTTRGRLPVDVPQRHVPRCVQQACSSTHKVLLAMMLSQILQWWRIGVSGVRLGGAGVGWRLLATAVAGNTRDRFVFLGLLGFYLQIQDNHFILVCLLVSTYAAYCNLIFD